MLAHSLLFLKKNLKGDTSVDTLLTMMARTHEGSDTIMLTAQEHKAAGVNTVGSMEGRRDGKDREQIFLQALKRVIEGGRDRLPAASRRRAPLWNGRIEREAEAGATGDSVSNEVVNRHGLQRRGGVAVQGTEGTTHGDGLRTAEGADADAALSSLVTRASKGAASVRGEAGEKGHGGSEVKGAAKGKSAHTLLWRKGGDETIGNLHNRSCEEDDQSIVSLTMAKDGDKKGRTSVSFPAGVGMPSVAATSAGAAAVTDGRGTVSPQGFDKRKSAAIGNASGRADSKAARARQGLSGEGIPDSGSAAKTWAGRITGNVVDGVPVDGKSDEVDVKTPNLRNSADSAMNEKVSHRENEPGNRAEGIPPVKMQRYVASQQADQQGMNVTEGTDRRDEMISGRRLVNDSSREGRLPGRTPEERHASSARIDTQAAFTVKSNDPANVKPGDVVNQITTAVQTNPAKGYSRAKIALNPPHLGTVDVDVIVRDNRVHVILKAEHHEVRQILQSHADALKTGLNVQGLVAETVDVFLYDRMSSNSFQFGHNGRLFDQRQDTGRDSGKNGDDDPQSEEIISPEQAALTLSAGDGRISLFA